jgi:hypothetical protein
MESAVSNIHDRFGVVSQFWGGTAENLTGGKGFGLRDRDFESVGTGFEFGLDTVDGGYKLDGPDEGKVVPRREISPYCGDEVLGINLNVDKDVEGFNGSLVDRNKT